MKKTFTILLFAVTISISCMAQQSKPTPAKIGTTYGKAITKADAVSVRTLETSLKTDSTFYGKIQGEVVEVCKKKGCFLTLKREGDQTPILVRFTDYAYFVPADIVGKTVVVEGKAKVKETSVERLQHYAQDMGKSDTEIAAITKPKKDISVVADGVLVVK